MENKETSFERMLIAVREMFKEDVGVDVISCNSHTNKTLKVVADPAVPNTVSVLVPYQIFDGAKYNEVCACWQVEFWKMALRQLCLEFGVKDCPRTRLMTRKNPGVNPRTYAEFFWKGIESMSGWNIVTQEIPAPAESTLPEIPAEEVKMEQPEAKEEKNQAAASKYDIQKAYELMGLKFANM